MSKGSNFKSPGVNFYRAFQDRSPEIIAANIHLLFMGEQQTPSESALFFSQLKFKSTKEWKEEIVYPDVRKQSDVTVFSLPNGEEFTPKLNTDWRAPYVSWLCGAKNRQFAEVMVNRMWFWLMGEGFVLAPDPERWEYDSNLSQSKLFTQYVDAFIASGYDLKALCRSILLSADFQSKDSFLRERLPAEILIDQIAHVTGMSDRYQSRVPEPFTFYPIHTPARDLGDATVSSPTLELFGKTSRDVSLESQRDNTLTDRQTLYLMNSNDLERKIRNSPTIRAMIKGVKLRNELVEKIFLHTLQRYPTVKERQLFMGYAKQHQLSIAEMAYDLCWVLLNSNEFLFYP